MLLMLSFTYLSSALQQQSLWFLTVCRHFHPNINHKSHVDGALILSAVRQHWSFSDRTETSEVLRKSGEVICHEPCRD